MHDGWERLASMTDEQILVALLALSVGIYFITMYVSEAFNRRGDEIRSGVVGGMPVSTADRNLLLHGIWLPYIMFAVGFLVFSAAGVIVLARMAASPEVQLVGYMLATLMAASVVFHLLIGAFHYTSIRKAIAKTDDRGGES